MVLGWESSQVSGTISSADSRVAGLLWGADEQVQEAPGTGSVPHQLQLLWVTGKAVAANAAVSCKRQKMQSGLNTKRKPQVTSPLAHRMAQAQPLHGLGAAPGHRGAALPGCGCCGCSASAEEEGGRSPHSANSGPSSSERSDRVLCLSLNQSPPGLHLPHLLPLELGQDPLTPRREKGRSLSRTVGCRVKGCEAPENQEISSPVAQQVTEEPQSRGAG